MSCSTANPHALACANRYKWFDPPPPLPDKQEAIKRVEAKTLREVYGDCQPYPGAELELVRHAWVRGVADYHFTIPGEIDEAIAAYLKVANGGQDSKLYAEALYKLAWSYYKRDFLQTANAYCARDLWKRSDIQPRDLRCAQLYDAFTPLILVSLEEFGLVAPGEAGAFALAGELEWPHGRLPTNTSGGSLSEAYVHGFNLICEGVRQIRGTAINQVENCEHVLVTSGAGVPNGALLLRG